MIKSKWFFIILLIISAAFLAFSFAYKKNENDNKIKAGKEYLESIIEDEVTYSKSIENSNYEVYVYHDGYKNGYWVYKNKPEIFTGYFTVEPPSYIDKDASLEEQSIDLIEKLSPEFLANGYEYTIRELFGKNSHQIYVQQINSEGRITGNYYYIYEKNGKIEGFELYNCNDAAAEIISEDQAIDIAYNQLDFIVAEMRTMITDANIDKDKEVLNFLMKFGPKSPYSYSVRYENLDFDMLKQIKYEAEIEKSEDHLVSVKLVSNEYALLYLVTIDKVKNNLDEAYDGINPGSKFLIVVNAYTGHIYNTAFEIISNDDESHYGLY